jgi:hypothetical protein
MPTSKIRVSSNWTWIQRFIFPAVWILICIPFAASLFRSYLHNEGGTSLSVIAKMNFLLSGIFGLGAVLSIRNYRLKVVYLIDGSLEISNYFRKIEVPLSEIADVREHKWIAGRIVITFKTKNYFGKEVWFIPRFRFWLRGFHPIAEELKGLTQPLSP